MMKVERRQRSKKRNNFELKRKKERKKERKKYEKR